MTDQTQLPDELRSAPPQPTIMNSTSMTMNAATVPLMPKPTPIHTGYVRIGCYDRRKFVIVLPQDICENLGIDIHTRLDYDHDADDGSIWVVFNTKGHLGVQHYRASCGGYQFTVRATDGSDYEEVKLRYNHVPVTYNCCSRTMEIRAKDQLQKLEEALPQTTETEVETGPGVDYQALAARLMDAQDELIKVFGDSLKYHFDLNEHIAGIEVSLA